MFYETSNVMFIIIILISSVFRILAVNGYRYDFNSRLKQFTKNVDNNDKKELDGNNYRITQKQFENQTTNSYNQELSYASFEEQNEHNSYQNLNFEDQSNIYDLSNSSPSKMSYALGRMYRREVPSNGAYSRSSQNSSLYPSVLTKALEISLSPSAPTNTGESLFSNVAQQMNTSTLDSAKNIAESETSNNDDQFARIIQNYIKDNASSSLSSPVVSPAPTQNMTKNVHLNMGHEFDGNEQYLENEHFGGITTSSLATILNRILSKLDTIHKEKNNDEDLPEGAPCDIIGSWSSNAMGLCFDIQLMKEKIRDISPAELNNKILSISVSECVPPKHHLIIDLDWKFTGSAIKQSGGPFYAYGQNRREGIVATFLGFCRKCGGIDTIFGSWNLLSHSKDCHDISLASDVKRDILRRVRMEMKRKERFKDLLYQSHHGKL